MDYTEILGWTATALLLVGYYLNAKQYIYSWLVWLFNDDDLCNAYSILFSGFLIYCSGIFEYFWIL